MSPALSEKHQRIVDRFVEACRVDERVVAALLVGSYAKGKVDEHSDLDLYVITTDDSFDDFVATRESFARLLGEPLFFEDFDLSGVVFVIYPNGAEVEIYYAPESSVSRAFDAPFKALLDKKNITAGVVPAPREFDRAGQTDKLRRLIQGFWHDLSHFATALGRGQLWAARGQLDVLRAICVSLARLTNDFTDPNIGEEVYFKIENAMDVKSLASLQATFCPLDRDAMLDSVHLLVRFYRDLAPALASKHGIPYPEQLEQVVVKRLETLSG